MLRILGLAIIILTMQACNNTPRNIAFPAKEKEFPDPEIAVIKIPHPVHADWRPAGKKIKPPRAAITRMEPFAGPSFESRHEKPLKVPLDSFRLSLADLPSVSLSLEKLPAKKIIPRTILLRKPKKTKAGIPVPENQFINGLREMGQDQGLPGTSVHSIVQDKNGAIWLATDNGLCFFDGENIYTYVQHNGISRDYKNSICIDKKGHIWAAGDGVDEIIPEEGIVHHYGKQQGLTTNAVVTVMIDPLDRVCLTTVDGVDIIDIHQKTLRHISPAEGLGVNYVNRMTVDHSGRYWFATNCGGVNIYDPATEKMYSLKAEKGLSNNDIRDVICDKNGLVWMGGWNGGVDCWNVGNGIFYQLRVKQGLSFSYIHKLMEDHEGKIWVSFQEFGVDVYDPHKRTIKHFYGKEGFAKSTTFYLYEDNNHCVWMGCSTAGIVMYDPAGGTIYNYDNKFWAAKRPIRYIYKDRDDNIWLSSSGQGTDIFFPATEKLLHFNTNTDWTDAWTNFFVDDGNGHVYMGTEYRLNRWDKKTGKLTLWTEDEGLPHGRVIAGEVVNNQLIMGTRGGLDKYDPETETFFHLEAGGDSLNSPVTCMLKDRKGNVWAGVLGNGLLLYNSARNELTRFGKEQGLSSKVIYALLEDHNGCIWIGTESDGLKKIDLDHKTITSIGTANGLSEMTIVSLLEKDNHIYAGTTKGLSVIDNSKPSGSIISMGKAQGFRTVDFNTGFAIEPHDTSIWWGVGDMVINYKPSLTQTPKGKTLVTAVEVMDKELPYVKNEEIKNLLSSNDTLWQSVQDTFYLASQKEKAGNDDSLNKVISYEQTTGNYRLPVNPSLPYNQDHVTFYFTGNYLSNTDKTRYRYILEGLDARWSPVSAASFADYRNIPPGSYTFRVSSSNNDGEWSLPASFSFTITPPWWLTKTAYTGYVFLIVLVIIGYNRLRTHALLRRQKELEQVVTDRTRQIREQKEIVDEKQKEIIESITYAKRLQEAILPPPAFVNTHVPGNFIFYRPKDIVAGDFYWAEAVGDLFFIAAADSTGHGVPGAMVSVVCSNALNRAVKEFGITDTGKILDKTRELVLETFEKSTSEVKDGMDISLLCIDRKKNTAYWSWANNPLWFVSNGAMQEVKPDKQPVGKSENPQAFTTHRLALENIESFYLFTDGFADQFGGPGGKKFKYKQLASLLLQNYHQAFERQVTIMGNAFEQWRGGLEQVDDVLVIGIKV